MVMTFTSSRSIHGRKLKLMVLLPRGALLVCEAVARRKTRMRSAGSPPSCHSAPAAIAASSDRKPRVSFLDTQ
jgi:hypothetical protein